MSAMAFSTLPKPADGYIVERDLGVVFGTAVGVNWNFTFSVQKAMQDAARAIEETRTTSMNVMGQKAAARGANIVLGVCFDTEKQGGAAIVTCWGTACVVKAAPAGAHAAPVAAAPMPGAPAPVTGMPMMPQ